MTAKAPVAPQPKAPQTASAPNVPPVPLQPEKRTNELAIAALVLGILGFLWIVPIIGPILGIIFGAIALSQIKQGKGTGRGMAHAGLWLGVASIVLTAIVAVVLLAAVPVLINNSDTVLTNSRNAADTAKKLELNGVAIMLEAYHADKGYYPAQLGDIAPTSFAEAYSYVPAPSGCVGTAEAITANPSAPLCTEYTVSVVLDDGSEYVKENAKPKSRLIPIPSVDQTQSTELQTN
jgi:Domain of unknown function (DUF4190)